MKKIQKPEKILYSIAHVNALTGIPKPTIRFWEKEFKIFFKPLRTEGNQRRYTRDDVKVLKKIQNLIRIEGFTLEGAKKQLSRGRDKKTKSPQVNSDELAKLADTMSDYLLKKLLDKTNIR